MFFDEAILFTDKNVSHKDLSIVQIQPISSVQQYSNLVIKTIGSHINTDHVLFTQTDGYIVNESAWDDEFLEYDYVGAPWWYFPFNHIPPNPPSTPRTCVGNGGFSLRSSSLMRAVTEIESKYSTSKHPEDIFICRTLRDELEKIGHKWAPEWLAHRFSCEDRPYNGQFGCHGHQTLEINPQLKIQ
jgi:hypothetical protein